MTKFKEHYRVLQYRPQAAKSLRSTLHSFIRREFPRLGGSWVVWTLVDKLLEIVDSYRFFHGKLKPGQIVWPAVAVDERPVYRKPMWRTRQVPVIVTIVNQDDVDELRNNAERYQLLKQVIVRAASNRRFADAYSQGGVLTCTDLGLLFQRSHNHVAAIIREYEAETGDIVPRRGNVHDMGRCHPQTHHLPQSISGGQADARHRPRNLPLPRGCRQLHPRFCPRLLRHHPARHVRRRDHLRHPAPALPGGGVCADDRRVWPERAKGV
jgi:hypothetical protein